MPLKPLPGPNGKPPNGKSCRLRVAGHFGEFLQGRVGGGQQIALITVPCPVLGVQVQRVPGRFALHQPGGRVLTRARAAALLQGLGLPVTGRFVLWPEMPVGGGAGASTAALVALAYAAGYDGAPQRLARACIAVEGASDPLMLAEPGRVLWASRRGEVLARMPALPRMEILGGFYGAPCRTDPADSNFPQIDDLVAAWPAACADLPALAQLASGSAQRCLALRGPEADPTAGLARQTGAAGWLIAHTGAARGLIFAPGTVPPGAAGLLRAAGLRGITRFEYGGGNA